MTHDEIGPLLPDLGKGRLDPSIEREIGNHLDSCADCRSILRTFEFLASEPAAFVEADRHPSTDELIEWGMNTSIGPGTSTDLREHVEACDPCRRIVEAVRLADSEVVASEREAGTERVPIGRYLAFAASIAGIGILGIFLGRQIGMGTSSPARASLDGGGFTLTLLQGALRDRQSISTVEVPPGVVTVPIAIAAEPPASSRETDPLELTITDKDGSVVHRWSTTTGGFRKLAGASAAILLVVPRAHLPDGTFTLYIKDPAARGAWFEDRFVVRAVR